MPMTKPRRATLEDVPAMAVRWRGTVPAPRRDPEGLRADVGAPAQGRGVAASCRSKANGGAE
jgi:hypothetical protein